MQTPTDQHVSLSVALGSIAFGGSPLDSATVWRLMAYVFCAAFWITIFKIVL